ncbi:MULTISPECIES: hypothetical protein [Shewanella]|uniref:hypothetical protein n=1 Tax=Shewanella TaxID=22 RepID=UPI00052EC825|nr:MULTISPECIES: hypothetical protein [Shewanella]
MIESYTKIFWLNELKGSAEFLESLYRTTVWDNELEFKTEKAVFLGFYAIRKLRESKLLSNVVCGLNTSLISHPTRKAVSSNKGEHWSKKYNMGQSDDKTLPLKVLCDQFVHSKIYSPFVPCGLGCMGFFFASDSECKNQVYYVQLIKIVSLFLSVVHDKKIDLELEVNGKQITAKNLKEHT